MFILKIFLVVFCFSQTIFAMDSLKSISQIDFIKLTGVRFTNHEIPNIENLTSANGIDDILYQEDLQQVILAHKQGYISVVKLPKYNEQFQLIAKGQILNTYKTVLSSAGFKISPTNPQQLYFCALKFYADDYVYSAITYDPQEEPGVYALDLSTGKITSILKYLPKKIDNTLKGKSFSINQYNSAVMNTKNARPFKVCNDLDISKDGQRIYVTESYQADTENGPPAVKTVINESRTGRIWRLNLTTNELQAVSSLYSFPNGITLDNHQKEIEDGFFFSEISTRRIFHVGFKNLIPTSEVLKIQLSENPKDSDAGMPDGLERDPYGNIHIALFKDYSRIAKWVKKFPQTSTSILDLLPYKYWPVPEETGLVVLDPHANKILFSTKHDGSFAREISVVSPGSKHIFLSVFMDNASKKKKSDENYSGLFFISNPMAKE